MNSLEENEGHINKVSRHTHELCHLAPYPIYIDVNSCINLDMSHISFSSINVFVITVFCIYSNHDFSGINQLYFKIIALMKMGIAFAKVP